MPYDIEHNKNGTYSVVNKESGKRLSKGTTKKKAEKQIKAIYVNGGKMKPEHAIRYFTSLLKDRHISNPLHRKILEFSKDMLRSEEKHGAGFWDDLWGGIKNVLAFPSQVIQEIPFVKEAVGMIFPEALPILEIVPQFTKYIYGEDTNLWLSDMLSEVPMLGDVRSDKGYKSSKELGKTSWFSNEGSDDTNLTDLYELAYANQKHTLDLAKTMQYIEEITPQQSDTPYEPYAVPTYNPVHYDVAGNVVPMDSILRFPMIYNYENTDQPKNLQDYLISNGVAGKDFSIREFGNVVENQRPYAFLDFPINGGNIRKISYAKTCH